MKDWIARFIMLISGVVLFTAGVKLYIEFANPAYIVYAVLGVECWLGSFLEEGKPW